MFNIPEHYKTDIKLAIKDFIPKDLKLEDKKRIKEAVKEVRLMYQIVGEEVPSVIDNEYRCQAIQIYDMDLHSIKDAAYLASMYQSLIKPFCVIRMHDSQDELYSFAVKRLSQTDDTQIVIEYSLLTERYPVGLPDANRNRLLNYLNWVQTKNKINKVNLYKEWYYKVYMLLNGKAYTSTELILDGNSWYDSNRMELLYTLFKRLVDTRGLLKKTVSNADKMKLNKDIKKAIQDLDKEIN